MKAFGRLRPVLLLVLALSPLARAQELETRDLHIRRLPGLPAGATHGYHEVTFEITNASKDRVHDVRLEIPADNSSVGWTHGLRRMVGESRVPPGSTVVLELRQPPLPLAGDGVRVIVDGRAWREVIPFHPQHPADHHLRAGVAASTVRVLVSQRAGTDDLSQDDPERYLRATIATSNWSVDWLAYSGYDGVVVTEAELDDAGAAVGGALLRYAEAGGSLSILEAADAALRYAGFGVVRSYREAAEALSEQQLAELESSWTATQEPWTISRDPSSAHRLFSVNPDVSVPVRGIFLVVVAFSILIGPVNLVVLSRRKKRIWMLWTVPAAALLTSGIVFLYSLFSEGLLRIERTASLTLLDQTARRAVTLGWTGYYSTLTPGGGLVFDRGTEVSPVVDWSYSAGGAGSRVVDWRSGQHLVTGFVAARMPAYFIVRKAELRRERLAIRPKSDALEVTNGLGADVEELVVADADGRLFTTTGALEAGASGRLVASSETARGRPGSIRAMFHPEFPKQLRKLDHQPALYLEPGTYLARLGDNPFLEHGLGGVRDLRAEVWVYGRWSAETRSAEDL